MSRQYYQRGRLVEAEELDDVIAVKMGAAPQERVAEVEADLGSSARGEIREAGVDDETTDAFARANWIFVRPNRRTREALTTGDGIPRAEAAGKVIRRPNGRIGIATDALTVRLEPTLSEEEAEHELETAGLTVVNRLGFAKNLYEVRAPAARDALAASVELHDNDRFVFAEPSFIEHVPARFRPTGAQYPRQWQWRNAGTGGGTSDADVHIEPAWDRTFGRGIRVAVIDNGFDAEHPDLAAGVDRSSGFFTDAVDGTVFVQGISGMPDSDHGTFCAGMAGARLNNGTGGTGAAPECSLILLACLPDQVGPQTTLARAVAYAADPSTEVPGAGPGSEVDILVSSLGPNGADWDLTSTLELALEFAATRGRRGRGLPVFWAASNGRNVDIAQDEVVSHPDVIAVVRSTNRDREDNAARGPEVELIAPGVDVLSTTSGGGYGTSTGTSFAAPCAAGCAALALAVNPHLTRDQLREVMHRSADKVGGPEVRYDEAGHNDDYGFGRVNAAQAVALAHRMRP
ncbi:S8 family serine peptidase [Streptomyces sp. Tu 3180]|uniref:S8 family serine peptidase n=1 Tax=Streptomyces sp. Tu 3180 TaxID=2682611 RepID=UPI001359D60E|nr:S8 family serine peptidase [Streptomyces sp. Tu 3180]KAF3469185.1 S8 family serine peptidase [Streptomyces sp. Tu 3180]